MLIIINELATKMTGGAYHILKVAEQWHHNNDITYLIPRSACASARKWLQGEIIVIDSHFEGETSSSLRVALSHCARMFHILRSPPRKKYDVIVASSHFLVDVLPAAYLQSRNSPSKLAAYYHGLAVEEASFSWRVLRKMNDALSVVFLRKYFDLVFAINQPVKDFLISKRIDAEKIRITDNGVDPNVFEGNSEKAVADACYVGRLVKNKGIFDLVRIWKGVCNEIPNAKLLIVGDGADKYQLIKCIEKEGLKETVVLCGFVEEEKKFEIMHKSKLFLLASYADTWGIVVVEALSCGLPVIAYDLPVLRTIWGNDVTFVPKGDTESFTKAVIELLRNRELRSDLSCNGLKRSKDYLWTHIAGQEADAIEKL